MAEFTRGGGIESISRDAARENGSDQKREYERLNAEWDELQREIRQLLAIRGKTEEQIRNDQWRVESLIQRADELHQKQKRIHDDILRSIGQ